MCCKYFPEPAPFLCHFRQELPAGIPRRGHIHINIRLFSGLPHQLTIVVSFQKQIPALKHFVTLQVFPSRCQKIDFLPTTFSALDRIPLKNLKNIKQSRLAYILREFK